MSAQAEVLHDGASHQLVEADATLACCVGPALLTCSYGSDGDALATTALELADSHGRVHVISLDMAVLQSGHRNVMLQSLHGGPGRAGGGEEFGGLRALNLCHRRSAVQAHL
ncbi:3,4-dehydroadipyl-CoA semialdehyde dehydrogenase [Polaromonas sp. CG_9.11]|nr:3,4-dehydroadipyl-CoA semialdehyde dehydrogenase [Polaromonas sp. CG_9.11]